MPSALEILRDPYLQVTYLFVTGVAAIYCLIGLWAATSRRHWFLRAIIPCLALAALIPIRAHEPLIFYALIMAEIIAAVTLWRWWRPVGPVCRVGPEVQSGADARSRSASGTYKRFRFGLRDLFLIMVVGGVLAWIVAACWRVQLLLEWPGTIAASALLAAVTVCTWNVVAARHKRLAICLLLLAVLAAVTVEAALLGDWLRVSAYLQTVENSSPLHDATIESVLYFELTALLLAALVVARSAHSPAASQFVRQASTLTTIAALILASIPLATLYWQMLRRPTFPPRVDLAENVFPLILERGATMESSSPAQANAIYQKIRPLLDRRGQVPVDVSSSLAYPFDKDRYWQRSRSIGRAIEAEATRFGSAGKFDEAADRYLSIMKLGQMLACGGVYYDVLVGHAVQGVGSAQLIRIRTNISPELRAKVLTASVAMEADCEPVSLIIERDSAYLCRTMRWRLALDRQLPFRLFGLTVDGEESAEYQLRNFCDRMQARRRLLYTDLALRSFHDDRGRPPQTLDELVPEYIREIPIDPYADKPLVYRPNGDSFILYSVGPDCTDNGGTPKANRQNIMAHGIDWDLDSLVPP